MRLLESNATKRRTRGGTVLSILVHVTVIGAAVVATARAGVPEDETVVDDLLYVAPPPPPTPAPTSPSRAPRSGSPTSGTPTVPHTPLPDLSVVPIGIPPVTTALDPLRGLAESFERGGLGKGTGEPTGAPSGDGPWSENLVERAALPLGQLRPRYPEALRAAGIGGSAVLRFVVDTLGRVERGTVEIVRATDPRFGEAAQQAVGGLRFRPAEARGRRVRQLVELPFEFRIE
jgi:protein TonB